MDSFCRYILMIICAALVVGILSDLMPQKGSSGKLFRMIGGLFLAFSMISPIVKLDFSKLDLFFEEFQLEGNMHAAAGESEGDKMYRSIIKSRTEAYILDKAGLYGAQINADITLSEDASAKPESALMKGNVSPYVKKQLTDILEEELGISKENQKWIE